MKKNDILREHSNEALRLGYKDVRLTLNDMIDFIQKQAIPKDSKSKPQELTDDFVNECLMKYQKTMTEAYESIPNDVKYAIRKNEALAKLTLVRQYAPQPITDKDEIINLLLNWRNQGIDIYSKKIIMPMLKAARVDMRVANEVLTAFEDCVVKSQNGEGY